MKAAKFYVFATFVASALMALAQPAGYELVWSDEFDGSELNNAVWTAEFNGNGGGNQELQYYSPVNVTVSDGCLHLTAKRQELNGRPFTSGRIYSMDKVFFTYGYVESRMCLPKTANGLWPAFWLLGNDMEHNPWPNCGEIDVLEMGHSDGISAGTQERLFNGACHWGPYIDGHHSEYARSSTHPSSLQDGKFHTFGLLWTADKIEMFVDHNVEPYFSLSINDSADLGATSRAFRHDFFLVYDLAVGGIFTGILNPKDITALPTVGAQSELLVDYVRVYQPAGAVNLISPKAE